MSKSLSDSRRPGIVTVVGFVTIIAGVFPALEKVSHSGEFEDSEQPGAEPLGNLFGSPWRVVEWVIWSIFGRSRSGKPYPVRDDLSAAGHFSPSGAYGHVTDQRLRK
jgi:hypothetical protein